MSIPLRVLIADDHAPTRVGVRRALERDGIEVCAEVSTADEAVEAALRERPDACILDIRMPGGGISAASLITFRLPATVVLMLTASHDGDDLLDAVRSGATGYLLKDMNPAKLPVVVRAALAGEVSLPRMITGRLLDEVRRRPHDRHPPIQHPRQPPLTTREWEVLELLCEDRDTGDIATRLHVSQVTVRRHLSNILAKLGVGTREEAVALVLAADAGSRGG